jgi:hypothetical protein
MSAASTPWENVPMLAESVRPSCTMCGSEDVTLRAVYGSNDYDGVQREGLMLVCACGAREVLD